MTSSGLRPLPPELARLLGDLAGLLGVDELRLFGGAALDLLQAPTRRCDDLDLALPDAARLRARCLQRLGQHPEIRALGPPRPYLIRHTLPVVMLEAGWRGWKLDVNFVNDHAGIGHFDIERVFWLYPECGYGDPHGVTPTPVRELRLVSDLDADNPVLLLNRVLKLSAKYDLDPSDAKLRRLVAAWTQRAADFRPTNAFHGPQAHAAHLRALSSAVRRAHNPARFLTRCLAAGLLEVRLRPLAEVLEGRPEALAALSAARTDQEFWHTADAVVANGERGWRRYPHAAVS